MLVIAYRSGQAVSRLFKGMHLIFARGKITLILHLSLMAISQGTDIHTDDAYSI